MIVTPRSDRRAAIVILCGDLADQLDLEAVEELLAPAPVVIVDGLCRDTGAVARTLASTGYKRAVVGLCSADSPIADLLARARRSGAEPFGVVPVSLAASLRVSAAAGACRTLAAVLARVEALTPGENGRAVLGRAAVSRASLLSLGGAISIEPVAAVDATACAGASRCGLCIGTCPQHAIASNGMPVVHIDPSACDACGLCIPVCPVGAIHLTGAAPRQLAAELTRVLPAAETVMFRCRNARISADNLPAGWATVELPSLAPVTPGWILQALAGGARAVRLAACTGSCCSNCVERVAFTRTVLGQIGISDLDRRVALLETVEDELATLDPIPAVAGEVVLQEPRATLDALERLGRPLEATAIEDGASPLGLLELDAAACTLCGSCALICPVDSLTIDTADHEMVLRHDPRLCTGCMLCVLACPERAIIVRRGLDRTREAKPVDLARGARRSCACCGAELPSDAIVRRVHELLGTSLPDPVRLCPDCARRPS